MMDISIPYDWGQKLYGIKSYKINETCKCHVCNGTGEVTIKKTKWACPLCGTKGVKFYGSYEEWRLMDASPLRCIGLYSTGKITYVTQSEHYDADCIFDNICDACKACEERTAASIAHLREQQAKWQAERKTK